MRELAEFSTHFAQTFETELNLHDIPERLKNAMKYGV